MMCPRCGSDSDRVDGDHLVIVEPPLEFEVTEGATPNTVRYTVTSHPTVTWCSSLPHAAAQPRTDPPAGTDTRQGG